MGKISEVKYTQLLLEKLSGWRGWTFGALLPLLASFPQLYLYKLGGMSQQTIHGSFNHSLEKAFSERVTGQNSPKKKWRHTRDLDFLSQ